MSQDEFIRLKCVKQGSKLRIKILSPGFSPDANCQFPKNIRLEGREYKVPSNDVSLCDSRGKFFYRVRKHNIIVLDDNNSNSINDIKNDIKNDVSNITIYGDENMAECSICMNDTEMKPDIEFVILAPCGHYCLCNDCALKLKMCPMCRENISQIVTKNQLQ